MTHVVVVCVSLSSIRLTDIFSSARASNKKKFLDNNIMTIDESKVATGLKFKKKNFFIFGSFKSVRDFVILLADWPSNETFQLHYNVESMVTVLCI